MPPQRRRLTGATSSARSCLASLVLALAACSCLAAASTQRGRSEVGGGMDTISPSVIENVFTHQEADGSWRLDLLVLWRGEPGWFLTGGRNGMSSGSGPGGSTILHNRHADVDFDVVLDASAGIARVAGTTVRLDEANVVLVDGMPNAMKIVGRRKVNERIARPPIGLQAVFRGFPELDAFLRCNETNGNPVLDYFRASCTWGPPK